MDVYRFTREMPGELIPVTGIGAVTHAFLPAPLPPNWAWPNDLWPLLVTAHKELARLDGIGRHLPEPNLLLRPLQRREARSSSELEGTFTNPRMQMLFELDPLPSQSAHDPLNDYREVMNYASALRLGASMVNDGTPFSPWFIRQLHGQLMEGVRGSDANPGSFREKHVVIGRPSRFVPPPPFYLQERLDNFEFYARQDKRMVDPLVDAFLMHYQFEAIHPFEDGNGRVGRLLLALMITRWCGLANHWLYMSTYFDTNRDEYLERLFRVSAEGDWSGWIRFCLDGVLAQAVDAQKRCNALLDLSAMFRERVNSIGGSWRLQSIVDGLFSVPVVQITMVAEQHGVSYPTARSDVQKLVDAGILEEMPDTSQKTFISSEIVSLTFE